MKIRLVRNATLHLTYAGKTIMTDPMLAEQGAYPGFPGTANAHLRNPLVPLPMRLEEVLAVDATIVTHVHPDHWDEAAARHIPKTMPLFVQNSQDAAFITASGFQDVRILHSTARFADIALIKTTGQHGSTAAYTKPELAQRLGQVCGVIFKAPGEKTLYVAGDTIWTPDIHAILQQHQPEVIVLNTGDAQVDACGAIIMGKEDVLRVHQALPSATIVATHMEAINHCILGRDALRHFAEDQGFSHKLYIPSDGVTCHL